MVSTNRKAKDSIFVTLFEEKENIKELYETLHPEDHINIDDIEVKTIKNVLTNNIYNDLGFMIRDHILIFVEAQSTWNENILIRCLMYLGETLNRIFTDQGIDVHHLSLKDLPVIEFYCVYTGERLIDNTVELSNYIPGEYFNIKIGIITEQDRSLIGQYITFSKIFTENYKRYEGKRECIEKTLEICQNEHILEVFLNRHRSEAKSYMENIYDQLFDQETVSRNFWNYERKLVRAAVKEEVRDEVIAEVKAEVKEEVRDEAKYAEKIEIAKKMKLEKLDVSTIIKITGLSEEEIKAL